VRTPPITGPTTPMSRMAMGMKRAVLCCRSVEMHSSAAGRWKISEEAAAHRNTPYHISETHSATSQSEDRSWLFNQIIIMIISLRRETPREDRAPNICPFKV